MEVNIKELSKEEIIETLRQINAIVDLPESGLVISNFLRNDLSLNLEMMELALSYLAESTNIIFLYELDTYYKLRGIELDDDRRKEESRFILGFCTALANEHSSRGPILVSYYDKSNQ
jgi:hypothetical protein